jgi:uncharacterized protein YsxB (DUF464 family)
VRGLHVPDEHAPGIAYNMMQHGKPKAKVSNGKFDIKHTAQNDYDAAAAAVLFNNLIIGMLQLQATYPGEIEMIK